MAILFKQVIPLLLVCWVLSCALVLAGNVPGKMLEAIGLQEPPSPPPPPPPRHRVSKKRKGKSKKRKSFPSIQHKSSTGSISQWSSTTDVNTPSFSESEEAMQEDVTDNVILEEEEKPDFMMDQEAEIETILLESKRHSVLPGSFPSDDVIHQVEEKMESSPLLVKTDSGSLKRGSSSPLSGETPKSSVESNESWLATGRKKKKKKKRLSSNASPDQSISVTIPEPEKEAAAVTENIPELDHTVSIQDDEPSNVEPKEILTPGRVEPANSIETQPVSGSKKSKRRSKNRSQQVSVSVVENVSEASAKSENDKVSSPVAMTSPQETVSKESSTAQVAPVEQMESKSAVTPKETDSRRKSNDLSLPKSPKLVDVKPAKSSTPSTTKETENRRKSKERSAPSSPKLVDVRPAKSSTPSTTKETENRRKSKERYAPSSPKLVDFKPAKSTVSASKKESSPRRHSKDRSVPVKSSSSKPHQVKDSKSENSFEKPKTKMWEIPQPKPAHRIAFINTSPERGGGMSDISRSSTPESLVHDDLVKKTMSVGESGRKVEVWIKPSAPREPQGASSSEEPAVSPELQPGSIVLDPEEEMKALKKNKVLAEQVERMSQEFQEKLSWRANKSNGPCFMSPATSFEYQVRKTKSMSNLKSTSDTEMDEQEESSPTSEEEKVDVVTVTMDELKSPDAHFRALGSVSREPESESRNMPEVEPVIQGGMTDEERARSNAVAEAVVSYPGRIGPTLADHVMPHLPPSPICVPFVPQLVQLEPLNLFYHDWDFLRNRGQFNLKFLVGASRLNVPVYLAYSVAEEKEVVVKDVTVYGDWAYNLRKIMDTIGKEPQFIYYELLQDLHRQRFYLVSDFMPRGTLLSVMNARHLDANQARCLFYDLVLGVFKMHQKGVAHRDLVPENLYIDNAGHLKLGDFESAFTFVQASERGDVMAEMSPGTLKDNYSFMSPELIQGRTLMHYYDQNKQGAKHVMYDPFKADVYAVGVLYHFMRTRTLPWQMAAPQHDELYREFSIRPSALAGSLKNAHVPRSEAYLITRMLWSNPTKRPSMVQLFQDSFFKNEIIPMCEQRRPFL